MRFRENLADFILIDHAARLVRESDGCSEEEAREDVVLAIQAFKVLSRGRDVRAPGRKYLYSDGGLYDSLVQSLSPHSIDWDCSVVSFRYGGGTAMYELEVARRELETLWPSPDTDAGPIIEHSDPEQAAETVPKDWYEQVCAWLPGPYYEEHKNDRPHPNRDIALAAAHKTFKDWPITTEVWRNQIWKDHAHASWRITGPRTSK